MVLLADRSDWDVYEAENSEVALGRIQEVKPDVVVLAVMMAEMKEMNGLELASKIRNLAPETRVVFMSSYYTSQQAAVITRLFGGTFVQKIRPRYRTDSDNHPPSATGEPGTAIKPEAVHFGSRRIAREQLGFGIPEPE